MLNASITNQTSRMMGKSIRMFGRLALLYTMGMVSSICTAQEAAPPQAAAAQDAAQQAAAPVVKVVKAAPLPAGMSPEKLAGADKSKLASPDLSKLPQKAKSYSQMLDEHKQAQAAANKPPAPKKVNVRNQNISAQVHSVDSKMSGADAQCHKILRKLAGEGNEYIVRDISFLEIPGNKVVCMMRGEYVAKITDGWKMQMEVVGGYGKNHERAYTNAIEKALERVKNIRAENDKLGQAGSNLKNASDDGIIPFLHSYEYANGEWMCKLYFNHLVPSK